MAEPIIPPEAANSTSELINQLLAELADSGTPAERALILNDHPGKRITIYHLQRARTEAEAWLLVAWRFPWLYPPTQRAIPASLEDVRKLEKTLSPPPPFSPPPVGEGPGVRAVRPEPTNNLQADLARLLALPPETLLHPNGLVNKSAVARALGRGTGGGQWSYIVEVSNHFQAEIDARPDEVAQQQEAA